MTEQLDAWLRTTLDLLSEFQFSPAATAVMRTTDVRLVANATIDQLRGPCIAIPIDRPSPSAPERPWIVPFGSGQITLWNRVDRPGAGWEAVPTEAAPAWWRHPSGTLVPAWNLWANLRDLLTFREERETAARDEHGRFPAEASPRLRAGLLRVPAANDANALLLDAAFALRGREMPRLRLDPAAVLPPGLVLSHDCDQLHGNDVYTQSIRGYRVLRSALSAGFGKSLRHAAAIARNTLTPEAFFAGNLFGMIDLERQFGFRSTSYFLTGRGGRFGARSGTIAAQAAIRKLPVGWEAGVNYNYHTVGSDDVMREEILNVKTATGEDVIAGRAHYLRFDPVTDPVFLERNGIRFDESIGWSTQLAYRPGIAGPFAPFDLARNRPLNLLAMPLVSMEAAILAQGEETFRSMWSHLQAVGGLMSVLVHPGAYSNPEFPEYDGLYERILSRAYAHGARSWSPRDLLAAKNRATAP